MSFVFETGVYISKYSDCLDLKRWYDGKTGYIVLLKLTKVKKKKKKHNAACLFCFLSKISKNMYKHELFFMPQLPYLSALFLRKKQQQKNFTSSIGSREGGD